MPPPTQTDRNTGIEQHAFGSSGPLSESATECRGGDAMHEQAVEVVQRSPAIMTSDTSQNAIPTDCDRVGCVDLDGDNFASEWRDPPAHLSQHLQGPKDYADRASPVANSNTALCLPQEPLAPHSLPEAVQVPAPSEFTQNVVSFPSPPGSKKTRRPGKRKVTAVGTHTQARPAKTRPEPIANRPSPPKRWRDLTEREKFYLSIEHCKASGGGAVTLNLSLDRAASLISEGNVTSPVRLFQNGLNLALRNAWLSGVPYSLKFELSPAGRLHLHGVFDHGGMNKEDLDRLKRAFRNAAGFIKGKAGASQLQFQEITDAAGWDRYLSKANRKTLRYMGVERLILMSQSMKRRTREYYSESRRNLQARLVTSADESYADPDDQKEH